MGVLTLVALVVVLPPLPPETLTGLTVLRDLLGVTRIRVGLVVTVLVVTAHFGTYTYVTPFLEDVTRAGPRLVTVLLLTYGVAGIVGNVVAGVCVRRAPRATFATAGGMLAAATLLLP